MATTALGARLLWLLPAILLLTGSGRAAMAAAAGEGAGPMLLHLVMEPLVSDLQSPLAARHAGDERLFIVERAGLVRVVAATGELLAQPFLDIRGQVGSIAAERGLLSLAFHPDYSVNGAFFVFYTGLDGAVRLDRYRVGSDPNVADPASRVNILTVAQPSDFHNGGDVVFGPDGYLYASLGDGGPLPADPLRNGQNGGNLLGTIVRLDVDSGTPYSVPADNPFVGDAAVRDEIWALGLRNPWRFAFDRLTGDLYIGDVGEWTYEEVNVEPAGGPGGRNYGWRCFEGEAPFFPEECAGTAVTPPDYVYDHHHGCAVAGGHVYRGAALPALAGHYLLADICRGRVEAFDVSGPEWRLAGIGTLPTPIVSLDETFAGELVAVLPNYGAIYRLNLGAFSEFSYLPLQMK